MTLRSAPGRVVAILVVLAVVASVVCVAATVRAGPIAPVFSWHVPAGSEFVVTKEQYELVLRAQRLGRLAAAAAVVLGLAAIGLSLRYRRASRAR